MRHLIVALACLLLFSGGWWIGKAQTARHLPGGSDWKALPSTERDLYLTGFVQGYRQGILHGGSMAIEKLAPEKVSSMTPAQKSDYEESLRRARKASHVLMQPVSDSGLDAAMSAFYRDYRNIPVCFDDAILLSAMALAGSSATEQELRAARKTGVEQGCR